MDKALAAWPGLFFMRVEQVNSIKTSYGMKFITPNAGSGNLENDIVSFSKKIAEQLGEPTYHFNMRKIAVFPIINITLNSKTLSISVL